MPEVPQSGEAPQFYFRIREPGAAVFLVDTTNRQRRIEMAEIATVNLRKGTIRPHGDRPLSPAETEAITAWIADRRARLARRDSDDIDRLVDQMNLAAHWAQTRASEAEIAAHCDALLMAMHDLRAVLVKRQADRLRPTPPG